MSHIRNGERRLNDDERRRNEDDERDLGVRVLREGSGRTREGKRKCERGCSLLCVVF